jgi:hypothetical protein
MTALAAAIAAALVGAWLVQRALGARHAIRRYHTWDCGQPIDATMEYTATGFSAPVRFFLRDIVTAEKHLVFEPVTESNPWIRRGRMEFRKAGGILARLYFPVAELIEAVGDRLRHLQNGVIQFYIALILALALLMPLLSACAEERDYPSALPENTATPPPSGGEEGASFTAELYFVSEDGRKLYPEEHTLYYGPDTSRAHAAIEGLLDRGLVDNHRVPFT